MTQAITLAGSCFGASGLFTLEVLTRLELVARTGPSRQFTAPPTSLPMPPWHGAATNSPGGQARQAPATDAHQTGPAEVMIACLLEISLCGLKMSSMSGWRGRSLASFGMLVTGTASQLSYMGLPSGLPGSGALCKGVGPLLQGASTPRLQGSRNPGLRTPDLQDSRPAQGLPRCW